MEWKEQIEDISRENSHQLLHYFNEESHKETKNFTKEPNNKVRRTPKVLGPNLRQTTNLHQANPTNSQQSETKSRNLSQDGKHEMGKPKAATKTNVHSDGTIYYRIR